MPDVGGILTQLGGNNFKIADAHDVRLRNAKDLTAITVASGDYLMIDDISADALVADGTEDSTGRVTVGQLGTYIETGLSTLTVDNIIINGSTIGHTGDIDLLTVASGILTVAGEVSMTTLDIGGTNVTSTATELNKLDALTRGSIIYGNASGVTSELTKGNADQVLTSDGDDLSWEDASGGGASALNDLSDVSYSSGDLTISSLDKVTFANSANADMLVAATAHNVAGKTLTISAGDTTAGTTNNIAGGALTLQGGQGKGSGAGGTIIFQTANAGSSGSSINSLATALTIDQTGNVGIGVTDSDTKLEVLSTSSQLKLSYDATDYFSVTVAANGNTTLATNDNDASLAHMSIEVDGFLAIKTFGGVFNLFSTDNASDYATFDLGSNGDLTISTTDAGGALGHLNIEPDGHVEFDGCAVGFDRILAADATNVEIDFTTGNKAHLDMTGGSISGTLTLKFPDTSGNFVLVVQQDGSTRTIAAFATKDAAGNAGDNDGGTGGAIRWAGGSAPDLTDGSNKRDVLSFYWDADEEVCYGVASLNF